MRLFLVNMHYPHHRVALQPGCEKTAWAYKWVGRLPIAARNPVEAVELLLAHLADCMGEKMRKHWRSCTVYVTEHAWDDKPGIKFSLNGNPDLKYRIHFNGEEFWPELREDC